MEEIEVLAPFWDHAEELRKTLLKILCVAISGIIAAFAFHQPLINLILEPLQKAQPQISEYPLERVKIYNSSDHPIFYTLSSNIEPEASQGSLYLSPHVILILKGGSLVVNRPIPHHLYLLSPLDGMLTVFKLSFWTGLVATAPLWSFFAIQFIYPALRPKEKRLMIPFLILSFLFISIGIAFAYYITIPLANSYLETFNKQVGINLWTLSNYLDYTFFLFLANAVACELSAVGFFLVQMGVITSEWLKEKRQYFYLAAFILGAVLTPPDVITQILLASLLIAFYELIILYAQLKGVILFGRE